MAMQAAAAIAARRNDGGAPMPVLLTQTSYHFDNNGDVTQLGKNKNSFWFWGPRVIPAVAKYIGSVPIFPSSPVPYELDMGVTRARHTLWLLLNEPDTLSGMLVFIVVIIAILMSIITFCIQTLPDYRSRQALGEYGPTEETFDLIESICVGIFTFDYLGRLLTATACPNMSENAFIVRFGFKRVGNKRMPMTYDATVLGVLTWLQTSLSKLVAFLVNPLNIVDLAAILPFYVSLAGGSSNGSVAIIRVLRLSRVIRLLRVAKGMEGVQVLSATLVTAMDALGFLLFFVLLAIILFGAIMFFCEEGNFDEASGRWMRPNLLGVDEEESPFRSIPHSMWYTMVTMTTVGYGDMYPTTAAGKVVGTLTMLCGIMVLALPITVVGSAFTEEYLKMRERKLEERKREFDNADEEERRMLLRTASKSAAAYMIGSSKVGPAPDSSMSVDTAVEGSADPMLSTLSPAATSLPPPPLHSAQLRSVHRPSHPMVAGPVDGSVDEILRAMSSLTAMVQAQSVELADLRRSLIKQMDDRDVRS